MARRRKIRWDRVALVFLPLLFLILLICTQCRHKEPPQESSSIAEVSAESSAADTNSNAVPAINEIDEFVVVIDPGHGGDDAGTTDGDSRYEKDDNLRIALAVRDALLAHPHVKVILTRETDVFITLQDRCAIANQANADVFVSLHRNSATEGNGIEIWVNNQDNSSDKRLAGYIMELLKDVGISKDRGIRSGYRTTNDGDNYYVNYYTEMPSCLIEMGFLTSDTDNQYFDERLDSYAEAIATGIVEYGTDLELYDAEASTE